jgi:hypothetical protein
MAQGAPVPAAEAGQEVDQFFGTVKYSAAKLREKGVILDVKDITESQYVILLLPPRPPCGLPRSFVSWASWCCFLAQAQVRQD